MPEFARHGLGKTTRRRAVTAECGARPLDSLRRGVHLFEPRPCCDCPRLGGPRDAQLGLWARPRALPPAISPRRPSLRSLRVHSPSSAISSLAAIPASWSSLTARRRPTDVDGDQSAGPSEYVLIAAAPALNINGARSFNAIG